MLGCSLGGGSRQRFPSQVDYQTFILLGPQLGKFRKELWDTLSAEHSTHLNAQEKTQKILFHMETTECLYLFPANVKHKGKPDVKIKWSDFHCHYYFVVIR